MKADQYGNGPAVTSRRGLAGPVLCPPRRASQGIAQDDAGGLGVDTDSPRASVGVWLVFTGVIWGAFAVLSPVLGGLPY